MQQPRALITCLVATLGAVAWSACGDDAPVPVASVAIAPAFDTVRAGATIQLTATPSDADGNVLTGRTITWATDDNAVATVDDMGLVTGEGNGTATITAMSEGQSGTADVRAWVGVTGTWMGTLDVSSGLCQLDVSIGESAAGAISGNSRLYAPCFPADFAVSGTNHTGGVTDSVFMNFTVSTLAFWFRGTFDGAGTLTGSVWAEGSGPDDAGMTRQSLTPGALAPTRVDGPSTAEPSAPLRRWPGGK